ncbi:MAG: hypothetical protein M0R37_15500 [Bacteroidales bacterium]|nr:hypothetical protein [Sphaerochaeta sp.]MCK9629982.1 hypothetical protein [Bacteroidales bacterium]
MSTVIVVAVIGYLLTFAKQKVQGSEATKAGLKTFAASMTAVGMVAAKLGVLSAMLSEGTLSPTDVTDAVTYLAPYWAAAWGGAEVINNLTGFASKAFASAWARVTAWVE